MQVIDADSVKDIKAEERAYQIWVKDEKNRILSMTDSRRKQEAWKLLFSQMVMSDDYLSGSIF
jgi:hypothetical protein